METLKNYLTQKSTYFGILKILIAVGLFNFAPELQDQIADVGVKVAEAVLGLIGLFLVFKDTSKK